MYLVVFSVCPFAGVFYLVRVFQQTIEFVTNAINTLNVNTVNVCFTSPGLLCRKRTFAQIFYSIDFIQTPTVDKQ